MAPKHRPFGLAPSGTSPRLDVKGHIAYLAGFTESAVAIPTQQRFLWERIEKRFKRLLGNRISPKDRKRIEAVLIAKIGKPPTKAQRAALDRKRERLLTGMR